MKVAFCRLPDDDVAADVHSSVASGNPLDIKVAADIVGRVARSDMKPSRIADPGLESRLREYLKTSVDLVLDQDYFGGEE